MEVEREFQHLGIPQMESLLDRYQWNEELASRLIVELATRRDSSPAARNLRGRLMSCSGVARGANVEQPGAGADVSDGLRDQSVGTGNLVRLDLLAGQVATVRPVGTSGLPIPKSTRIDSDFELPVGPDARRSSRYRVALDEYIKERRTSGQGKQRNVRNGTRSPGVGKAHLYTFEISDIDNIAVGAEVDLLIDRAVIKGTIQTIAPGEIGLDLEGDVGAKIPRAKLRFDNTKLLEKLCDRISEVERGEIEFNVALANAAVGAGTAPRVEVIPEHDPASTLNASQLAARRHVLKQALTFIWGPPGCGKTLTLGEVVRSAFDAGKRMLICSNTNKAVDQVLYSICKALGEAHPAMQDGQIVRLGVIADRELAAEFGECVDIERIAERLSADLRVRIDALEQKIAETEREVATMSALLQRFAALATARSRLTEAGDTTRGLQREAMQFAQRLVITERQMIALAEKLRRRGRMFHIFGPTTEQLTADLDTMRAERAQIESTRANKLQAAAAAAQIEGAARSESESLAAALAGQDCAACEARYRETTARLDALKSERETIEKELADLRTRIMREARVIGATGTRVYLTPKEMGLLDLVIVDEVSMLLQPMIWVVAGLSRERVVLCGDFRQLPAIFSSNRQVLRDLLGRDVFEAAGLSALNGRDERMVMLDTQYRMDEAICALISDRMYAGRLKTPTDPAWRQMRARWPRPPPPFDGALTLIDTSALRPSQAFEDGSRLNLSHALLVRNLAHHLTEQGFAKDTKALAVCTPYKAHQRLIAAILKEASLEHVQVGTTHTFQGDQRNAVILDFPESPGSDLGYFLQGIEPQDTGSRLINVAVSRSQNHLLVMANLQHLDARLPSNSILRGVLWDMQRQGRVLSATALLAIGPRGRDLEGLEDVELDDPARRFGAFNSQTFDSAFAADVARAHKSIAIFSGFVSRHRVSELKTMLRNAVQANVKVRCISRPPHKNFPKDPASGAEAFDILETIGCVVDGRARVHEKAVIIDQRVLWHGSLNVLSFSQQTDELMTRTVSMEAARAVAGLLAKLPVAPEKVLDVLANRESPPCGSCGGRSYYDESCEARYFECENNCGWRYWLSKPPAGKSGRSVRSDDALPAAPEIADSPMDWSEYLQTAQRPYLPQGPRCPRCESATWLRRRSKEDIYFYGCSRYQPDGCKGSISIPGERAPRRR